MRILVTAPYHEKGILNLNQEIGEVIYRPWKQNGRAFNEEELLGLLYETEAEALITEHDHVTEKVINANAHLQFIGVCRGTPSNVALEAATQHGIPVFFTPARNAQAVAELFVANVISFLRHTEIASNWLKTKQWDAGAHTAYLSFKGNELAGKTVGMVGFGAIGRLIAKMLACFPCPVRYYDPYVEAELFPDYRKMEIDELFRTSDIVSVHLPVTEDTKGLIDKKYFSQMRRNAIFVNTARAVVVNRSDLYDALRENKIRGGILDVFDHEPPDELDYKIINLPNVLATPHIAGATHEVEDHHVAIMNDILIQWFRKRSRSGDRLANRDVLTSYISPK